jgi:hypothetical protein
MSERGIGSTEVGRLPRERIPLLTFTAFRDMLRTVDVAAVGLPRRLGKRTRDWSLSAVMARAFLGRRNSDRRIA